MKGPSVVVLDNDKVNYVERFVAGNKQTSHATENIGKVLIDTGAVPGKVADGKASRSLKGLTNRGSIYSLARVESLCSYVE